MSESAHSFPINKFEDNFTEIFSNFLIHHPKITKNTNLHYLKDNNLEIGYILSNPIIILNSENYSPYGIIKIDIHHENLLGEERFCGFIFNNDFYILIYDNYTIYIYSFLTNQNKDNPIFIPLNISLNGNNDIIVKIQYIKNEIDINYFIVVSNNGKIYFLTLFIDQFNNKINPKIEEFNFSLSNNYISNSFFSLWPFSKNINESEIILSNKHCFILYPLSYSKLQKNTTSKGNYSNCLIFFSSFSLKKFSFTVTINGIFPEMNYINLSIKNEILSKLYNEGNEIEILCADSLYNKNNNKIQIFFIVKTTTFKHYLYQINLDEKNNIETFNFNISHFYKENELNPETNIIVNKFSDEGLIIIDRNSIIYFNSKKTYFQPFDYNIIGINPFISPDSFNVDLLTSGNGIRNFQIDSLNNNLSELIDKTPLFISQFQAKGNLIQQTRQIKEHISLNNNNINSQNLNRNIKKEYVNYSSIPSQNNILRNKVNFEIQNIPLSHVAMKVYNFLNEIFKQFLSNNYEINNKMKNDFNNILNSEEIINNPIEIQNSIDKIINGIINNDSLNIEYINKNDFKSENAILNYLQQRYEIILKFYILLKKLDYFQKFPEKEIEFYTILEKLIVIINIRKEENEYYTNLMNNNNYNDNMFMNSDKIFIHDFLLEFYNKMKVYYSQNEKNKPFSKQFLYFRLVFINEFFLCEFFETAIEILEKNKDNPNIEFLYNFLIIIILNTNKEIEQLINQFPNKLFFSYRNTFWFLSKNNSNSNKHLYNYLFIIYKKTVDLKMKNSNSIITDDQLFEFADQLQYLNQLYYNYGNKSSNHNKDFYKTKKEINKNLELFGIERAFDLCKKYKDYSNLTKLAFQNKDKLYESLKNYMKKDLKYEKERTFLLKLLLQLEIKKCVYGSDYNNCSFNYFEDFDDFLTCIELICKNYPKIYEFFLSYKIKRQLEKNQK